MAVLELQNPEARNAMSVGMMVDFLDAAAALKKDPPTVLIVCGSGTAGFCAGGDLRDVRDHLLDSSSAEGMPVVMGAALNAIAALPSVVISAVDGHALGGGAELSQVADWVILGPTGCIGFVHARLGVSPGWGGAARLIHRLGRARALRVMVAGHRFRGAEALAVGLADQFVEGEGAVETARTLASRILTSSDAAVRGILDIVRSDDPSSMEAEVFARLWGGPDHRAALSAVEAGQ